ncbi:glutathione peroxidase [Sarotherodon galilaeus]
MDWGGKAENKKGVTVQEKAAGAAEEEIGVSEMVGSTEVEEREPTLSDLMSTLQAHMGQQEAQKTYRQRFRSLELRHDENPKIFKCARLKNLYGKWIQPKGKTSQEIGDIIILEQYLRMLSPELQVWIRDHSPFSMVKASELAEVFVAARKKGQPWTSEMYHQRPVSADKTPVGEKNITVTLLLNLCAQL